MRINIAKLQRLIKQVPAIKIALDADLSLRTVQRMRSEGIGRQRLYTIVQLWAWAKGQK